MPRHSSLLPETPTDLGATMIYRPQRLEVRTRRAPKPPLWARACIACGILLLLSAILTYGVLLATGR